MGEPSRAVMAVIDRDGSGILHRDADTLSCYRKPDIFDTDQGSHFTGQPSPWCSPITNTRSESMAKELGATTASSRLCPGLTIFSTGSGSRVGNLRTLLLSGYPGDDRTVNYLTIP
jgi:hypothetical protein